MAYNYLNVSKILIYKSWETESLYDISSVSLELFEHVRMIMEQSSFSIC